MNNWIVLCFEHEDLYDAIGPFTESDAMEAANILAAPQQHGFRFRVTQLNDLSVEQLKKISARKTIVNHYYKDSGHGERYMSGLPLPRDPDGVVRNVNFVGCTFHPCCAAKFENCSITGDRFLKNMEGNFELP